MAESRVTTLNRPCKICHDLAAVGINLFDTLAVATLEAFYRASGSCTICLLIYKAALVRDHTWRDIHLGKVLIRVRKSDNALFVRGMEILKPGPFLNMNWRKYGRALFDISLYSPLRKYCVSKLPCIAWRRLGVNFSAQRTGMSH